MKKLTISLCILGFALTAKAQVGVNTTNPRGIFDVDGAKNNTTATDAPTIAAESKDDVVVDATGKVGIGTNAPAVKLDIETGGTSATPIAGFKLADGTQQTGATLMSDANGVGTWKKFGDYVTTDVEFSSMINTEIPITIIDPYTPTISSTQALAPSSITVTIPSGYTSTVVLLSFDVWGDSGSLTGINTGGSLRFHLKQTNPDASNDFIPSISMTGWAVTSTQVGRTRFSAPVGYTVKNLAPGTYTYTLYVNREAEGSSIDYLKIWGIQGRATVLVK